MTLMAGWVAVAPADPPLKKLTLEERKKLEAERGELNDTGSKQYQAGKLSDAGESFAKALAIARRLYPKDKFPEGHLALAVGLSNLAAVLQDKGKYANAESLLREALDVKKRLYPKEKFPDGHLDLLDALDQLAYLLRIQARFAEAEPLLRDALDVCQRLYPKDHPHRAHALNELAVVLKAQGKLAGSEPFYREALDMYKRLYPMDKFPNGHRNIAVSQDNVGLVLKDQGKYADAEPLLRDALEMHKRLFKGDHPDTAIAQSNFASLLLTKGKLQEAKPLLQDTLDMRRRLFKGDHPDTARSLNFLAGAFSQEGNLVEAELLFRDALDMRRRVYSKAQYPAGHPLLASSLSNVAGILERQGRYASAELLYQDAQEMWKRLFKGDHTNRAMDLNCRGRVLVRQDKLADAELFLREALEMRRRLFKGDHPAIAESLNNVAGCLSRMKQADAERLTREALEMNRRLHPKEDSPHVAAGLNNLAAVLWDQGKYADAEQHYRQALDMKRRLYSNQDADLALGLDNLAAMLNARGKYADAEPLHREALAMYRALAAAYAAERSEGDALTFASKYPPTRDGFLSNARARQAEPAAVYAEIWASKSAIARVYERRALSARAAANDPRAAALLDQLTDRRRRRADLLLTPTPTDPSTRKERYADLAQYAKDIEALDRKLRPLLPALDRTNKLGKATPADLQKVLPADTAVVDFLGWTLFEQDPKQPCIEGKKRTDRYTAFVVTKGKVSWIDLGPAEAIEQVVAAWREAINLGKDIPPEMPAKVRELVWTKVRQELPDKVKAVYVSPDLALCRIPWAALPGDKPKTILLEDYAVAVLPHAMYLLDKLWPQDPLPNRPAGVFVVGGAAYNADLPVSDPLALKRGEPLIKPAQKSWPDLPWAVAEAKGVAGAAAKKKLPSQMLGGKEATTSAVLAALPKARYAHLSTHGFFADPSFRSAFQVDPKLFEMTRRGERVGAGALSPLVMTGLVFAGANNPKTSGRGVATGESLIDLDLSGLELAVLSACETGLGDVAGGEGTFGLQRAFHLAGTRDVVASLWKVPDQGTAALMAEFYRNLWDKENPLAPLEALRKAQLEIYHHPDRISNLAAGFRGTFAVVPGTGEEVVKPGADGKAHPRLWAAFTLSGPGR